jgi:tripartite-type tricarboxylate transporter receptor subunit TctC
MIKIYSLIKTLVITVLNCLPMTGHAQSTDTQPIRLIVPWPAGGNADVVGRVIAAKLSETSKRSYVVENRSGAGGNIGMELVARAPKDGTTLGLIITANAVNVSLYPNLSFDLSNDLVAIGSIAALPLVLVVHPSLPIHSVRELIELARKNPGKINYASGGNGTLGHLAAEMFKAAENLDILHVPYKGATPAMMDLLAGRVQIFFDGMPSALPHIRSEKIKVIAITTNKRSLSLPEVPTFAEAGLANFEVDGWFGLMGPAGLNPEMVNQINHALNLALDDTQVRTQLSKLGLDTMTSSPSQFAKMITREITKWGVVVKTAKIKID